MQLKETIKIRGKPFPKPLPIKADILVEYLSKEGIKFENLDGETLLLYEIYMSSRLTMVKKLIESKGLDLDIYHSLNTVYEEKDFRQNPLWILYFPDLSIDVLNFEKKCSVCRKKSVIMDFNKRIPYVKSKKPIVTVNGQFDIVRKELKKKIEEELSGAHFEPFDERGEYFYLLARNSLGDLVNPPEDFLDYGGVCPECNLPIYDIFFSPFKYSKPNWNGDDIVSGAFHEGVLFTEKAYNLLKSVEKEVIRYGVVILK